MDWEPVGEAVSPGNKRRLDVISSSYGSGTSANEISSNFSSKRPRFEEQWFIGHAHPNHDVPPQIRQVNNTTNDGKVRENASSLHSDSEEEELSTSLRFRGGATPQRHSVDRKHFSTPHPSSSPSSFSSDITLKPSGFISPQNLPRTELMRSSLPHVDSISEDQSSFDFSGLKATFDSLDHDGDGAISPDELQMAMSRIGFDQHQNKKGLLFGGLSPHSRRERTTSLATRAVAEIDRTGDGKVDWNEFKQHIAGGDDQKDSLRHSSFGTPMAGLSSSMRLRGAFVETILCHVGRSVILNYIGIVDNQYNMERMQNQLVQSLLSMPSAAPPSPVPPSLIRRGVSWGIDLVVLSAIYYSIHNVIPTTIKNVGFLFIHSYGFCLDLMHGKMSWIEVLANIKNQENVDAVCSVICAMLLVWCGVAGVGLISRGRTFGRLALGMVIVDSNTGRVASSFQTLFRLAATIILAPLVPFSLLFSACSGSRRTLADVACGTCVVWCLKRLVYVLEKGWKNRSALAAGFACGWIGTVTGMQAVRMLLWWIVMSRGFTVLLGISSFAASIYYWINNQKMLAICIPMVFLGFSVSMRMIRSIATMTIAIWVQAIDTVSALPITALHIASLPVLLSMCFLAIISKLKETAVDAVATLATFEGMEEGAASTAAAAAAAAAPSSSYSPLSTYHRLLSSFNGLYQALLYMNDGYSNQLKREDLMSDSGEDMMHSSSSSGEEGEGSSSVLVGVVLIIVLALTICTASNENSYGLLGYAIRWCQRSVAAAHRAIETAPVWQKVVLNVTLAMFVLMGEGSNDHENNAVSNEVEACIEALGSMMLDLQQVLKADMEFLSRTMPPLIVYPGFVLGIFVVNPIERSLWGLSFVLVVLVRKLSLLAYIPNESFLNGVGHTVNCYAGMYTASFSQSCSGILRLADHHTEILLNMMYSNTIAVTVIACSALPMLLLSMAAIAAYYSAHVPSSNISAEGTDASAGVVEDHQGDNSFNTAQQPQFAFARKIIPGLMGVAMDATSTVDIEQVASWTSGVVLAVFTALIFLRTAATTITLCCLEEAIEGVPLRKRHGGKLLRQCFARFTSRSIGL
eukprot:jgi/Bigna1/76799/fgenesh1_pg.44_\